MVTTFRRGHVISSGFSESSQTAISESTRTVLLVSKQAVICEGLRLLINQHPALIVAGVLQEIGDAHVSPVDKRPDVIALDVDLNGSFGLDRIPDLLSMDYRAPVLALVSVHLPAAEDKAAHFGAAGVVFKEQDPQIFIKALERVSGGEYWFSRSMMTTLMNQRRHSELAKINRLTKRERQVVDLVAKALKSQEIAEHLSISEATVRHHLTSIFQKIGVSDRQQLIVFFYEHVRAY